MTASRVLLPYRPSISPGEQCARSSRICARKIADPDLLAELSAGFFVASFVAAVVNAGTATLRGDCEPARRWRGQGESWSYSSGDVHRGFPRTTDDFICMDEATTLCRPVRAQEGSYWVLRSAV